MTAVMWIFSVLLIAEFVMAPINLWTGRTMQNFTNFTGLDPSIARTVFAPVKLAGALLIAIGLAVHPLGVAGAVIIAVVCAVYVILLAAPGRRDPAGLGFFAVGLIMAVVLAMVQAGR
ncbi:MAG: hypothetical protein ACRDVE_15770 [Actinocrinis sp.]